MTEPMYRRTHTLEANLLAFVLGSEAELIVEQARSTTAGRAAKTLVKEGPLRVTIAGMRQGAALDEHRSDAPVLIQVLSGEVSVSSDGGDVQLAPGGVVALDRGVRHLVSAQEDSALLLTFAYGGQ